MLPQSIRARLRLITYAASQQVAMRTANHLRMSPGFIIIGAQRCGTTSLYNYLVRHPLVVPATRKEVHFFDKNFEEGVAWYRCHFPTILHSYRVALACGQRPITGEASPYYIFHPAVPRRVSLLLPNVKVIAMVRNPVDRAYSHYQYEVRIGVESLPFERAIECEDSRLGREDGNDSRDRRQSGFNHQHYSYLTRGIYVDQLRAWDNLFPRDQILVIQSEQFYLEPWCVLRQVLDFLGLPEWEPEEYEIYNQAVYASMDPVLRERLSTYFRPHNERLCSFLGRDLGWGR